MKSADKRRAIGQSGAFTKVGKSSNVQHCLDSPPLQKPPKLWHMRYQFGEDGLGLLLKQKW